MDVYGLCHISLMTEITFSVVVLRNLFMARWWETIGYRIGYVKVIIILLFAAGIFYFPGAFVTNIWQLIILRFLVGIAIGGIIPLRIAYFRQEAPLSMQGEVLGYNTSLRLLGNLIGPRLGGMPASLLGCTLPFVGT